MIRLLRFLLTGDWPKTRSALIYGGVHIRDVRQAVTDQLGSAMAAKTDNILREAVSRFLGRDDWTLGELKGRGTLNRLPSGVEVFCLDGVALVELFPITVGHEQKGAGHVLHATRQHRFLPHNAALTGAEGVRVEGIVMQQTEE